MSGQRLGDGIADLLGFLHHAVHKFSGVVKHHVLQIQLVRQLGIRRCVDQIIRDALFHLPIAQYDDNGEPSRALEQKEYMSVIALFLDHYKIGTRTKLMNILKYGYAELKKEIGDDNAYELLRDYMDTGVSIMRAEHMPKTFGIRFKFDFDGEEE